MIRFCLPFAAFVLLSFAATATTLRPTDSDSLGVEYRNNTMLIKHRVTPGETLYGIARRYKVPVENVLAANPKVKGTLLSGQIVLVPRTRVVLTPVATAAARPAAPKRAASPPPAAGSLASGLGKDAKGNRVYRVKPGQTLYSIATRFGASTTTLIKLNRLPASGSVNSGQLLIIEPAGAAPATAAISKPAAPVSVPAPEPVTAVPAKVTVPNPPRETPPVVKEVAVVKEEPKKEEPKPVAEEKGPAADEERGPERASEVVRRVSESGLAAAIDGSTTNKYLALHKTAPVGTIIEVRNIMNNISVFVRVIGRLPDTGENSNILIRLTPRAVKMLATPDSRFRVETSYLP